MARTIEVIQTAIKNIINATAALVGLTSTSVVADWLLWTYIVATCHAYQEGLYDAHKAEVSDILAKQKPHTPKWYETKAKAYQHGVSLPADTDVYAVVPPVDESVLIISNAAVQELGNFMRIKVARRVGSSLAALTTPQLNGFTTYMQRIKDAGVRVQCTSGNADNLRLQMAIFYDPLILDDTGKRLDGSNDTPVKDAINNYLTNLPFNGLFVTNRLIDVIEQVEGVIICDVNGALANYAATPYVNIDYEYLPDAGYLVLDEVYFIANINYTAHGPI